jgi:hypothetical protein
MTTTLCVSIDPPSRPPIIATMYEEPEREAAIAALLAQILVPMTSLTLSLWG